MKINYYGSSPDRSDHDVLSVAGSPAGAADCLLGECCAALLVNAAVELE